MATETSFELDWTVLGIEDYGPAKDFTPVQRLREFGETVLHGHFLNPYSPEDVFGFMLGIKMLITAVDIHEDRKSDKTDEADGRYKQVRTSLKMCSLQIYTSLVHFVPADALDGKPSVHTFNTTVRKKSWTEAIPAIKLAIQECVYAEDLDDRNYFAEVRQRSFEHHHPRGRVHDDMVCRILLGARCIAFITVVSLGEDSDDIATIILECLAMQANNYLDILPGDIAEQVGYPV